MSLCDELPVCGGSGMSRTSHLFAQIPGCEPRGHVGIYDTWLTVNKSLFKTAATLDAAD
jgi:hypothetical protein